MALVPVGFALSVLALFGLWGSMTPDNEDLSVLQGLTLAIVTASVALVAPAIAVMLSVSSLQRGERSATAALIVAVALLGVTCLAQVMMIGPPVGVVGALEAVLVLAVTGWRLSRPS